MHGYLLAQKFLGFAVYQIQQRDVIIQASKIATGVSTYPAADIWSK